MQTSLSPTVCRAFLGCQIEKAVDELNLTKKIISCLCLVTIRPGREINNCAGQSAKSVCYNLVAMFDCFGSGSEPSYGKKTHLRFRGREVYPTEGSCRFPLIVLQQTTQSFLATHNSVIPACPSIRQGEQAFRLPSAYPEPHLAVCDEQQDRIATSDFQPCERYCTATTRQERNNRRVGIPELSLGFCRRRSRNSRTQS